MTPTPPSCPWVADQAVGEVGVNRHPARSFQEVCCGTPTFLQHCVSESSPEKAPNRDRPLQLVQQFQGMRCAFVPGS